MTYTTDVSLGNKVAEALRERGVETPYTFREPNLAVLEQHFAKILGELGLDLTNDSLSETPKRLAKLYGKELYWGLDYRNFPKATVVENTMGFDEMVVERNIRVSSMCEHHGLPVIGKAFVAYIPSKKVIGLSKLNRIVDFFARRPQVQERLTLQIYYALSCLLETENVAVLIQAEHQCVKHRGVGDQCSDTSTSKLGGVFLDTSVRAEYLHICRGL